MIVLKELPVEIHRYQVLLYAEYDRAQLLPFLKSSPYYDEKEALKVVQKKGFQDEEVYLLARLGNKSEALKILIQSANRKQGTTSIYSSY